MHHAHLVVTEGVSYRFAQARDGKGSNHSPDPPWPGRSRVLMPGAQLSIGGDHVSTTGEISCPPLGRSRCPVDMLDTAIHDQARPRRQQPQPA